MNLLPSRTSTGCSTRMDSRRRRWVRMPAFEKGLNVGQGAAVEDGQLQVVELDDDVVDAHADERGEQVLGGGDEHALAHEAGGIADLGHVAADGGNFEVVEIGAAEDDAGAGGRGQKAHGDRAPEWRPTPVNSRGSAIVCSRCAG